MKYKVLALDIKVNERPLQFLTSTEQAARLWAEMIIEKYHCKVQLFELKEELLYTMPEVKVA